MRWFELGMLCAILGAALWIGLRDGQGGSPLDRLPEVRLPGVPGAAAGTVQVFYVGDAAGLALVRDAIAAERVVVEVAGGFAVREGRIVAVDRDAVGSILAATGWDERPLEFHAPAPVPPRYESHGPFEDGPAPAGDPPGIASLARKPTLTHPEATAILEHLR